MRELIGKRIRILIDLGDNKLTFTGKIIDVSDTHISFIDKFNTKKKFRISDIIEVTELDDERP